MQQKNFYFFKSRLTMVPLNQWDLAALVIILGILALLAIGATEMTRPYHIGQPIVISLSPSYLPEYALRTVLRMFLALILSLLFTFTVGTWAAKNKYARQ